MAKKKLSVSLDDSVAREGIILARQKGLSFSAWLNEAAIRALIWDPTLRVEREGSEGSSPDPEEST